MLHFDDSAFWEMHDSDFFSLHCLSLRDFQDAYLTEHGYCKPPTREPDDIDWGKRWLRWDSSYLRVSEVFKYPWEHGCGIDAPNP